MGQAPRERLERLCRELLEARDYVELVDEQLDEIAREIDQAARLWHETQVERRAAVERVQTAMAALAEGLES